MAHVACALNVVMRILGLLLFAGVLLSLQCAFAAEDPFVTSSKKSLTPSNLALVVNDEDPNSVAVGEYYRVAIGIPRLFVLNPHVQAFG